MKLFYALCSMFFTVVVSMIVTYAAMDPYMGIVTAIATSGGFICYAILDSKDPK